MTTYDAALWLTSGIVCAALGKLDQLGTERRALFTALRTLELSAPRLASRTREATRALDTTGADLEILIQRKPRFFCSSSIRFLSSNSFFDGGLTG
jgi:hypothetical protein